MKKHIITTLLAVFGFGLLGFSQDIAVTDRGEKIDKIVRPGQATFIELDKKDVEGLWKKYLKDYGKVSSKGGVYRVDIANIPAVANGNVRVISKVEASSKGTMVWWTIDMGNHYLQDGEAGYSSAKKLLRDFAVFAYKEDVMRQEEEAQKAMERSEKEHDRMVKTGENLQSDLERNQKEKERLEQALADNAAQKEQLQKDLEQNKKDQEATQKEKERRQKELQAVRDKLAKIR